MTNPTPIHCENPISRLERLCPRGCSPTREVLVQEIGHADEDHLHAREATGRSSSAASGDSHGTSNLTLDRTCRRGPYPPRRPSSARAIWPLRVAWHPLASQPPPGASPPPRRAAPPSESPPRVSAGTRIDPDPSPSTRALDPPDPRRRRRRPRRTTGAPPR